MYPFARRQATLLIALLAGCAAQPTATDRLENTAWIAESIDGKPVLPEARSTLRFFDRQFAGGSLGLLLAMAIGDVPLRYPMGALSLRAELGSRSIGLAAALSCGLAGGIVPAWRAVRIPLVEAIGGRA